ncbi:tRNA dimethylallyltransferase [Taphrina deformans PYCC 5710]|uniref:tRNA dimethylallyltransferase n=1 Tax=Taphrina deformans (strain PYCC 5710 / ATCC 11124 / CBS 356.35 / IMI 108563 / JCM 9778 / NBRC 8474) TaxID=1097556 RepID=R4XAH7_TAPDE|nr:tRNA dimethylallyltransferase [Taphrina deformans PYCC 5710]|eukprot:CCG82829.1 tRNA dimethylallyltransferase [Taphrina deformans PYCC 5710]
MRDKTVVQVIGTTGVGKSQLGIELAKRLAGEIINSDSMQVYKGLDIITNKHPEQKRDGIVHHLLGFLDQNAEYRIGAYERDATGIIDRLHEAGKMPVVVGGTAYYSTSLVFQDMLPDTGATTPDLAGSIDARLEKTTSELYQDLQGIDPVMATRWHPKDHRKIRRSLEIYYTTGKRQSELYSEQRATGRLGPENVRYRTLFFWLWSDQSVLDTRLDARIDEMIETGLFGEIKSMHQSQDTSTPDFTRGIYQAIGYKEFHNFLQTGNEADRVAGTEAMKAATRRYARKQIKWIRNKLLLQCRQAGDDVQVVLLDATDLSKWDENVLARALKAIDDYATTGPFDPRTYCDPSLHDLLRPKVEKEFSANPDLWEKFVCDVCPTFTTNTKEGWTQHLSSNGHRAKVKQAKKRQDFVDWKKSQKLGSRSNSDSSRSSELSRPAVLTGS